MADVRHIVVPAVWNGIDVFNPPDRLDEGRGPVARNCLLHMPNKIVCRAGISRPYAPPDIGLNGGVPPAAGKHEHVLGLWNFNNKVLMSLYDGAPAAAGGHMRPWEARNRVAGADNTFLSHGKLTMKHINTEDGTMNNVVAANRHAVIGHSGHRLGDYVFGYGEAADNATNPFVTENEKVMYRTRLLRWDGTTAVPTIYVNAPEGALDVAVHLNRLFVLGGRNVPGGGTKIEFNSLYFSDEGGPTADTVAMWQDDVSLLVNKIVIGADDQNDYGIKLAVVGQTLIIFKRRSIWALYGYSKATFQVKNITLDRGCIDPRSVVEADGGVYFMSQQGYEFFDGSEIHLVSQPVTKYMEDIIRNDTRTLGSAGGALPFIDVKPLPNGYFLFTAGSMLDTSFNLSTQGTTGCFSFLFNRETGGWSEFLSNATSYTQPQALVTVPGGTYGFEGQYFREFTHVARPTTAIASVVPIDTNFNGSANQLIPLLVKSPRVRLAAPVARAQGHRLMCNVYGPLVSKTDAQAASINIPTIALFDGNGTTLLASDNLPLQGDTTSTAYRFGRRYNKDFFTEANDLQVEWAIPAGAAGSDSFRESLEIYDTVIGYQESHRLRTT